MVSSALAKGLERRHIHYGWVVMVVTFLTMLTTACALGAPGVLMPPLAREFGWTTAEISGALAVRLVLFGLIAPFAAVLMLRFGLKRVVGSALVLIVAGLGLSLMMGELWQLLLLWGIMVGCGAGMTAMVLGATVASRWFVERRGLVVGILAASSATGQLAFLPVIAAISEAAGWRMALVLVCALLAVALIMVLVFMRDRPDDVGLRAYGETEPVAAPPAAAVTPFGALREASRSGTFWVLFLTFFICGASTNGLIQTHFVSFCGDFGMTAVTAASVLALMGVFDLFGTVGSGWLSDRYDPRWLLFIYYGLRGIALLFLPESTFTVMGLTPFAIFYGLDWIATVPPTLKLTAQRFGREKAGVVFGWIFAGHQLGAASIAFFAGWVRTAYDTYVYALLIAGGLCLIAAALSLMAQKPKLA
ncbi:MFS transporter [Asticcacaulis sp. AND118]|uniref:MFS transporter n=1 Tax=Asticcacaulis sp. AND118 TaxID=2840468 RepID=UPI001CFF6E3A|nr:MFS transporter [Asticcacaulis sp. AND118]UDF05092.1 MFS transporter [Asticcacaulis sp. AND118]